jgi:hypothetical protein
MTENKWFENIYIFYGEIWVWCRVDVGSIYDSMIQSHDSIIHSMIQWFIQWCNDSILWLNDSILWLNDSILWFNDSILWLNDSILWFNHSLYDSIIHSMIQRFNLMIQSHDSMIHRGPKLHRLQRSSLGQLRA